MLNVLINAYAVSPNWGSEAGMGWNWIINLANHCNLFIITEGEWKDEIEKALTTLLKKETFISITIQYRKILEKCVGIKEIGASICIMQSGKRKL